MTEIEAFLAKRNEALRMLDLTYAREQCPDATNDEVLLMALHKARYECTAIEDEYRHLSGLWLRSRGYGRMIPGEPLLPPGELPK